MGRLFCYPAGYKRCHNAEEVIAEIGYDSERDLDNPTGSIFYANGAGFYVSWDQVKHYMHLESTLKEEPSISRRSAVFKSSEVDFTDLKYDYYEQAVNANKGRKTNWVRRRKQIEKPKTKSGQAQQEVKEQFLLVDGYNIIHAWPELAELAG